MAADGADHAATCFVAVAADGADHVAVGLDAVAGVGADQVGRTGVAVAVGMAMAVAVDACGYSARRMVLSVLSRSWQRIVLSTFPVVPSFGSVAMRHST